MYSVQYCSFHLRFAFVVAVIKSIEVKTFDSKAFSECVHSDRCKQIRSFDSDKIFDLLS